MRSRVSLALLTTLALASWPALADTRVTTTITDPDGAESTKSTWFSGDRVREDAAGRTVVVDLGADSLLLIDHGARTYNRLTLPVDVPALLPESARAAYRTMLERMAMDVEVSPAVETGEVGGYAATRFDVTLTSEMGAMTMELWMSNAVPVDIARYKAMMLELAELQPAAGAWMERLLVLDGYPVRTVNRAEVSGRTIELTEEIAAVDEVDPPAGHYAPPAGYAEMPFDPLADMRGGRGRR